jgi:hypothetical protein
LKIAIIFYGILRSLTRTIDSIEANVIAPSKASGDVKTYGHFFNLKYLNNPRSNEIHQLNQLDAKLLKLDLEIFEEPNNCLNDWDFEGLCQYGDAWDDQFKSLSNLVHQLHSINVVTKEVLSDEMDIAIFCRPDLFYHDSFLSVLQAVVTRRFNTNIAYIPFWQWHGGFNDRFSICVGEKAIRSYGCRIENLIQYMNSLKRPLHSESFLKYSLVSNKIDIGLMRARASRVRVHGEIVKESFSMIHNMGWQTSILKRR